MPTKTFKPKASPQEAKLYETNEWSLQVGELEVTWETKMDRVALSRKRLPYTTIESIATKANVSVKEILVLLDLPQTTYNKKKRDQDLLSGRDTEMILLMSEVLDYGFEVFNQEKEKFQRWFAKVNLSLGGVAPFALFDSMTGIQEVKYALDRIEYGAMA